MRPFATGGVYVNFAGLDAEAADTAVFGGAAQRLQRIRRAYDPDGLFDDAAHRP
jgi:FAD/FMN-containing dehydrogenase